ncbi:alpha-2-macroglobulin family protein [Halochromatium glycolicum]|nr:alpha-2-macroglobulin family protein [Halochromatium glycolicum]
MGQTLNGVCRLTLGPGLTLLLLALSAVTGLAAEPRELVIINGADYFGEDYDTLQDVGLDDCQAACLADNRCQAFTYNRNAGWCFLKADFGELRAFDGAISGYIRGAAPERADRRAERRSELAFLPSRYRDEADALRRRIAQADDSTDADGGLDAIIADAQRALNANDAQDAARAYRVAVRLATDDYGLWMRLAEAAGAVETNDWSLRQRFREEATAAAINAYLSATDPGQQARALARIGRALEARSAWREAIRAARASLALVNDPALQSHLDQLVAQHGFRVVDHSVSSDARDPRICIRFSDPLARDGVVLADYIALDAAGLAIEPEAEQICIDGVAHGERYRIEVREGLPSNGGERLAKTVELKVYVRDRSPSVRFPGRAYVLPSGGDAALPVVTVNTDLLEAALYRVGDRALGGFAADDELLAQLNEYETEALQERRGERLWKGQIETRSELNREVTTAIPIAELIAEIDPRHGDASSTRTGQADAGQTAATRTDVASAPAGQDDGTAARASEQPSRANMSAPSPGAQATQADTTARQPDAPVRRLAPGAYILTARPADALKTDGLATQWFVVSDLGLTALSADDGLHAFVRSLSSAEPLADVRLQLLALNQQVLGEARTDAQGHARFDPGLLRGEGGNRPALLSAEGAQGDFGFLDLQASPFDLSDRGVQGRPAPKPIDSYLVSERGIYRPGETVTLTALTRDLRAGALTDVPLTFVLERPDGVEFRREQVPDQGFGGHLLRVPLLDDAMRGTWQAEVFADPQAEALAQTPFLVEDFEPERLDFTVESAAKTLDPASPPRLTIDARYLYGAPAAGLEVEGSTRVSQADGLEDWPGWQFGLADDEVHERTAPLPGTETGADGKAQVGIELPTLAPSSRPLKAQITVQVLDGGGRPVERELSLPIADPRPRIGIRPLFDGAVEQGANARFEVMVLGGDGQPAQASDLRWTLSKVQTSYQWYQTDGDWRYEPIVSRTRVASGELAIEAEGDGAGGDDAGGDGSGGDGAGDPVSGHGAGDSGAGDSGVGDSGVGDSGVGVDGTGPLTRTLEAAVDWGAYELRVEGGAESEAGSEAGSGAGPGAGSGAGPNLVPASIGFEAGWYVAPKAFDTPDGLKVSLDKPEYRIGEQARVRLEPRFPGLALVVVISGDGLVSMHPAEVPEDGATVASPVTADWGPGVYVTAMLYRGIDLAARRMPRRAIGLHWAGVDPEERRLAVVIDAPERTRPRAPLEVDLRLTNLAPGETAYATLAAVDVGILNLTGFEPWSPVGWYFGQRRLGAALRDLYGRLIDRMQGEPGRLRTGSGARQLMSFEGPPPSEALVAFQSEILEVDANGQAQARFDLPDFNGQVQLMAMAWSADGVGQAAKQVLVRDPIVVSAAMPRFLAPGDRSRILVELAHVEGPAGTVEVSLTSNGEGLAIDNDGTPLLVELAEQGRARLEYPVTATRLGDNELLIRLVTPAGDELTKTLQLGVRTLEPPVRRTATARLEPGADALAPSSMLNDVEGTDFVPGTGHWLVSVSGAAGIDVPGLLWALDRYPYGCVEQRTSRALPLLYLDQVAVAAGLPADQTAAKRVRETIAQVLAHQASNGGFGLWSPAPGDLWLDAYVTDFLSRAREQGYTVPVPAFDNSLGNLRNQLSYASDFDQGGEGIAYGLYVLARHQRVPVGDLRYYLETKLNAFATPMARAQLGAALALYGERDRAAIALRSALDRWNDGPDAHGWRDDFGSHLRDGAALLAFAAEANLGAIDLRALGERLAQKWSALEYPSTQEQVWMLLAAHALMDGAAKPRLRVGGEPVGDAFFRRYDPSQRDAFAALAIANAGERSLTASVTASGVPQTKPPASARGYEIERAYYDFDGRRVDPTQVQQGARLVVLVTVTADRRRAARLIVSDPLPAGFEIDNPHLLQSGSVEGLPWLNLITEPVHTAFGADRFVAAVNRERRDPPSFQLAYVVRAVSPGEFSHPAAAVEAMYQPQLRGRTASGSVLIRAAE